MNVAIIGTAGLPLGDLRKLLPEGTTKLIVGTEENTDKWVFVYAMGYSVDCTRYRPKGEDRSAVIENIRTILQEADKALIFWDGITEKTALAINECISMRKNFNLYTYFHWS